MLDAITRLRALFRDRAAPLDAADADYPGDAEAEPDPEWDELLDWAREPATPTPVLLTRPARKPVPIPMTVCSPPPQARRPEPLPPSPHRLVEVGRMVEVSPLLEVSQVSQGAQVGQMSQGGQVGGQIDSDGEDEDEDEDEEWQWLVARAKANERSSPVPPRPRAIATLGPVSSLAQRLEKIAAAAAAARNGQGQVDQTSERASGSA